MNERDHDRQDRLLGRILVISIVAVGAVLIVMALILINLPALKPVDVPTQAASTVTAVRLTPVAFRAFQTPVDGTHLGDPTAPVKVDVWEDFQCPACKNYSEQTEPAVIQNYVETGKVYYTFHFYPFLDGRAPGGESQQAANAAMCALEQGRFWDYHDMLFANWKGENQGGFANARLMAFAEYLGLNMITFKACFIADKYRAEIESDFQAGEQIDIAGTPSVFVDGTAVTPGYVPSYDALAQAIEAALNATNE